MTLSKLRLYTVCYADLDAKTTKMYKDRENTKIGVREVNGQTVSEPGQFCRNVREGWDRAMVRRGGRGEEQSRVREERPGSV